jgi:hypothetical protein
LENSIIRDLRDGQEKDGRCCKKRCVTDIGYQRMEKESGGSRRTETKNEREEARANRGLQCHHE